MNVCYAACSCSTEYRCGALLGEAYGDMLEAMARIAPSQSNEAMARIAPRRNGSISLDPSFRVKMPEKVFLDVDSKWFSKVQVDVKSRVGSAVPKQR